jgi:hypothetical protein
VEDPAQDWIMAFDMSHDGKLFAVGNWEAHDRVDIWTNQGKKLFSFLPCGAGTLVDWVGFTAEGNLLVVGGGEVTAWQLMDDSARGIYRTSGGGYRAPCYLISNRHLLFASRGRSFDIVDVTTGQCRNRLGIEHDGLIFQIAPSLDGQSVAALYCKQEQWASHLRHRRTSGRGNAMIAIWNLDSGEAKQAYWGGDSFARVAWLRPDALCVCATHSRLLDLQLQTVTLAYHSLSAGGVGLGTTPDGRIWMRDVMGGLDDDKHLGRLINSFPGGGVLAIWKPVTLTGTPTEDEAVHLADHREIVLLKEKPIRLDIDLGNPEWGEKHGQEIADELQRRGFTLGPDGFVLRVRPRVVGSGNYMEVREGRSRKNEEIPKVEYSWQFLDDEGRLIFSTTTEGQFGSLRSKYSEASGGLYKNYDFGRKPMKEAVAEEIREKGEGLNMPFGIPPQIRFLGGDKYTEYPLKTNWTFESREQD